MPSSARFDEKQPAVPVPDHHTRRRDRPSGPSDFGRRLRTNLIRRPRTNPGRRRQLELQLELVVKLDAVLRHDVTMPHPCCERPGSVVTLDATPTGLR